MESPDSQGSREKGPRLVTVSQRGDARVIRLVNQSLVDPPTASGLERELRALAYEGTPDVVLDMSEVKWVSSPTVGALINFRRAMLERNGRVALAAVRSSAAEVFAQMKVDRLIPSYATVDEAIASFGEDDAGA